MPRGPKGEKRPASGGFATLAAIRRATSRVRLAPWVTDLV
jgi:hypothetical protein